MKDVIDTQTKLIDTQTKLVNELDRMATSALKQSRIELGLTVFALVLLGSFIVWLAPVFIEVLKQY